MNESRDEPQWDAAGLVGDGLGSVASSHGKVHELQYLRDDIVRRHTEDEIAEVFEELAIAGIGRDYLEGSPTPAGSSD